MTDKTLKEFKTLRLSEVAGDVSIACAESRNISFLSKCIGILQEDYPKIKYNLYSGDSERALEKLDKGIFDFAVVVDGVDLEKYNCLAVRSVDRWGVVMRRDDPLALRDFVEPEDLIEKPLIVSRQAMVADLPKWFGDNISKLNVLVGLDLSYNGSVLAKEGTGYLLTFDGLVDTSLDSKICFKPLMPELTTGMHVIWRRGQQFSRVSELFLDTLKRVLGD